MGSFIAKEMRTKTIWRSPHHPNHSIERTKLIDGPKTFNVYETQRVTELHVNCYCIGCYSNLDEAVRSLT